MSDIVASTSSANHSWTLGCEITNFYPPKISVTWLKLRDGEQDDREEEAFEGGEMWGPIETHPRRYRTTATLTRRTTNQEKRERGGGVVCRVDHCSLLRPIEKHWRHADVGRRTFTEDTGHPPRSNLPLFLSHSRTLHPSVHIGVLE